MKSISGILDRLFNQLKPPQPFSWQTLILLSIFSYLMALIAISLPEKAIIAYNIIVHWGLIFLILGIIFCQIERPWVIFGFKIWPWVIGLLLCILFFRHSPDRFPYLTALSWPVMSAVSAATPKFFDISLRLFLPAPPVRQQVIILILSHLLISCWVQFYFVIQDWLVEYPSLLADDFSRSAFVVRLSAESRGTDRGIIMLDGMEEFLKTKIDGQSFDTFAGWFEEDNQVALGAEVKKRLPAAEENDLWDLKAKIAPSRLGYKVELFAIWEGPSANLDGYYLKKSCKIGQAYRKPRRRVSPLPMLPPPAGNLECEQVGELFPGRFS